MSATEEREFNVWVERELGGWVKVKADSHEAAEHLAARMPEAALPIHSRRQYGRQARPLKPVIKYGRVLVRRAVRTCGPKPKTLLYLDCGHTLYIESDTWFPGNPYAECTNTACPSRR